MVKIGFTGTRRGMSEQQKHLLEFVLVQLRREGKADEFHHGDGADSNGGDESADRQAARIARAQGFECKPHPPKDKTAEALLARNRVVVVSSGLLIAAPEVDTEQLRSGTWATVRYARASGKAVIMLSRGKP